MKPEISIWVVMPGHISHIGSGDDEAPDYKHFGNKDNDLYDVNHCFLSEAAFLFTIKQEILYPPDVQNDDRFRTEEIHQEVKKTAIHLTDEMIQKPAVVKDVPVVFIRLINDKAYFLMEKGFWAVSVSSL